MEWSISQQQEEQQLNVYDTILIWIFYKCQQIIVIVSTYLNTWSYTSIQSPTDDRNSTV